MPKVKVESWGDDLALKLPDEITVDLNLCEGDDVDFAVEEGALVIFKLPAAERTSSAE